MIKKYFNTDVMDVCEMLHITDAETLRMSHGCVNKHFEETDTRNTLVDEQIFGKIQEDNRRMGHMAFPIPLVNINYLYGAKPILPRLLHMEAEDVEKIVYFQSFIVVESNGSEHEYKKMIPANDYTCNARAFDNTGAVIKTGAEAIEILLEKELKEQEKELRDKIILRMIPVLPICARYKLYQEGEKTVIRPNTTNLLYGRIINRINRLTRLLELNAPLIIEINEKRMFQEYVDALINNGARGLAISSPGYLPYDSLQEWYKAIKFKHRSYIRDVSSDLGKEHTEALDKMCNDYLKEFYPELEIHECEDDEEFECEEPIIIENYEEKMESIKKSFEEIMNPVVNSIIENLFKEYKNDYSNELANVAQLTIHRCIDNLNEKKYVPYEKDMTYMEWFMRSIAMQMEVYVQKRIMF